MFYLLIFKVYGDFIKNINHKKYDGSIFEVLNECIYNSEYSVQFPTNLTPTTATTKNLSIVNPETTARDAMRVST